MKTRNIAITISCVIVCCIALLLIFRGYYITSSNTLNQLLYENQKINIQIQQGEIISKVEDVRTTLKTMAAVLEQCESEKGMHKFDSVMEDMSEADDIQAQGVQYFSFSGFHMEEMSQEDQKIIEELKAGESIVSQIHKSSIDQKTYYGIAEPVSLKGEYVGFVRGLIDSDTLLQFGKSGVFGDDTETYLIHRDGDNALMDYLGEDKADNLFEDIKAICDEPEKLDKLKEEMNGRSEKAVIQTTAQENTLIISCASLPYNDWLVFNVVHSDKADDYVQRMADEGINGALIIVGMTAIVLALFFVIHYFTGKNQRYEKEKTALLANFSDTILCEYEMKRDCISCTSNIMKMLPVENTRVNQFRSYAKEQGLIFPEDVKIVKGIFTTMPKEGEILDYEIRLKNIDGEYNWYRIDVMALYIKGKLQDRLILKISDIAERKEKEMELVEKAQFDALTGLMNRDSFENKVKAKLEEGGEGYMFLLDIDDFKHINDTYGHQSGDEILKKAGKCIKNSFRSKDYAARYGGDEFFMFVLSPMSDEAVQRRASVLVKEISSITMEGHPDFKVTCSVGVVKSQSEGYEELLEKADKAMYKAKEDGKNSWIML